MTLDSFMDTLKKFREIFKKPANIVFAIFISGIGVACILGSLWIGPLFLSMLGQKPFAESDNFKIVNIVIGFLTSCFGVFVFYKKIQDVSLENKPEPVEPVSDNREIAISKPIKNFKPEDPYWKLKVDRWRQYDTVVAQTALMVWEQKPKSLVFVWYGERGQGVEIFHKRLYVEFRELLTDVEVYQVRPLWPFSIENYHNAFSDVLMGAFNEEFGGIKDINDIPAGIAGKSKGKPALVYVRHEPVQSFEVINPQSFRKYIQWWENVFAPVLEESQFAVLTVSFMHDEPAAFGKEINNENIFRLDSDNMVFWLLDEMGNVTEKDLRRFLLTHNITLPSDLTTEACVNILNKTGGRYEPTVEELKRLHAKAWGTDKKEK